MLSSNARDNKFEFQEEMDNDYEWGLEKDEWDEE